MNIKLGNKTIREIDLAMINVTVTFSLAGLRTAKHYDDISEYEYTAFKILRKVADREIVGVRRHLTASVTDFNDIVRYDITVNTNNTVDRNTNLNALWYDHVIENI